MKAKRLLSLLLCVVLTITMLPLDALAGNGSVSPSQLSAVRTSGDIADVPSGQSPDNNADKSATEFDNLFGDVGPGDWFYDDVGFVYDHGLMSGTGTGSQQFSPNMHMSRAMLVTVLYRLAGSPDTSGLTNTFTDVQEDTWYGSAVAWAEANGIISGVGGNRFAPDDNVTREQAAAILLRYARLIGKGPTGEITGGVDFADRHEISDWALEGAIWSSMTGVITGKPGDTGMLFDPQGNAMRAELAAMLHRFLNNVVSNPADETGSDEQPAAPTTGSSYGSGLGNSLTVSFQTNGGTAIDPVSVRRGGKLSDVPVPLKDDSAFTGWYTDSALTQPFYSDVPVTQSMTLYAAYADRDYNYREFVNSVKFLQDCEPDVSFDVYSQEAIDDSNVDEYISITNKVNSEEIPDVDVTSKGGDVYTISPDAPYTYTPGDTYELSLIDGDISFNNEQEEVRTIAFSIVKQEKFDVQFKSGIVYLLWSEVQVINDGVYSLPKILFDGKNIAVGTTICLTDELNSNGQGILNENSKIRNVLSFVDTGSTDPRVMLFTEAASFEDVYEQLDVYVKQSVEINHMINSFDTQRLARDVKNSEGTMQLTKLLAVALNESKTVADMSSPGFAAASSSGFTDPTEYEDKIGLTAKDLFAGLNITASIGHARDTNFHNEADDNEWVVLTLAFDYNGTINNALQVDASFTFKEYFTFTQGTASGTRTTDKGKEKAVIDLWIDAYSHTKVHFDILVKTVDIDGEYFDVTAEIEGLIEDLTEEDSGNIPKVLQDVLGKKGDYIDIAVVDLYDYQKPIVESTPIFQVNLDVDFVIRLNLAVGLSADYNLLSASRIGLRVDKDLGHTETYNYELDGTGKQAFDLFCAGYIGIKAGIRADLSLSFYGLEELASVGFTGEVGAYIDLYGFLQLHLMVEKKGATPDLNINGGLYMELGIYVELSIYAKSDFFKAKAEYTVLDEKFPLFSLGDQYVFLRFKNAGKTVLINSNRYALRGSGLMDCEMLDLKTGQVFMQDYSQSEDFYFTFSSPRFTAVYDENNAPSFIGWGVTANRNPNTIVVYPPNDGSQRIDTKVQVYYGGDQLCFSSKQKGYINNEMNLIWIDSKVDPTKIETLDTVTATYVVNMNGVATTVQTKSVLAGYSPGAFDRYSDYTLYAKVNGYVNNWNTAIWQNTTYTVNMTKLQALVDYIYLRDGQWHYDVYAVEAGDTPPFPEGYQTPGGGNNFFSWLRTDYRVVNFTNYFTANYQLTANDIMGAEMQGLTYTGYDKSKAVFTFTGTQEECYAKFNENQETNPKTNLRKMPVMFHNVGQYYLQSRKVCFCYPEMNYTAFGQTFSIVYPESDELFTYGETPIPHKVREYPFCTILGWDKDNDGDVDYAYDALPPATHAQNIIRMYYLVVEFKQHALTFNAGDGAGFPSGYKTYSVVYDYGAEADLSSIPAPVKPADNYNIYTLTGWQDEDGNSYGLNDKITVQKGTTIKSLTAVYTPTPIMYTITLDAGNGQFPDGLKTKTISGTYGQATDFSLVGKPTCQSSDPSFHYEFHYWENAPAAFTQNITISAVYAEVLNVYDATFNAGDGASFPDGDTGFTLQGLNHGYEVALSSVSAPVKPSDNYYTYTLTGWQDEEGHTYSLTGTLTVTKDTTLTAVFTPAVRTYTITVSAGNGRFSDGTKTKTFTGTYDQATDFSSVSNPARDESYADYHYEFAGWSDAFPSTFTQDMTITANYTQVYNAYTITFDAGSGTFEGGAITVTQTYEYGAPIVPPADPAKAENEYFSYTFTGWSPALNTGDTVTGDRTYTANYASVPKGTVLPDTGITVTDGEVTEDISVGSISGYTYEIVDRWEDGTVLVSTLTITGDGLTFSGESVSEVVYGFTVVVADTVSSVTFKDLSLSGDYSYSDGALYVQEDGSGSAGTMTINIEGSCNFEGTQNYGQTVRIDRPVQFVGADSDALLQIGAVGAIGIYAMNNLTFDSLHLIINADAANNAETGEPIDETYISAFGGDMGTGGEESFVLSLINSNVGITTGGGGLMLPMFTAELQGSNLIINCTGDNPAGLLLGFTKDGSSTVTITPDGHDIQIVDESTP